MQGTLAPSRAIVTIVQQHKSARRRTSLVVRAQAAQPVEKDKPDWTGDKLLSRTVDAFINFKPTFKLMTFGARNLMISTAEGQGISWRGTVAKLQQSEVYQIKDELEFKAVRYPGYYTVPFHGYDEGNLSWLAAMECEPAGEVMAWRAFKDPALTPQAAQDKLRLAILNAVHAHISKHGLAEPKSILDIGCSVGVSTRYLANEFPAAAATGLDLSPYMLAVAELRERQSGGGGKRQRITYVHRDMEHNGFPDASFEMVSVMFVTHELPGEVIDRLVKECRRLLKPGGILLFADNNPRSKVIQNLPPVLFTLMKSTEPHSNSYYAFDLEESMRRAGFAGVNTVESDPRHRAVTAYVPQQ